MSLKNDGDERENEKLSSASYCNLHDSTAVELALEAVSTVECLISLSLSLLLSFSLDVSATLDPSSYFSSISSVKVRAGSEHGSRMSPFSEERTMSRLFLESRRLESAVPYPQNPVLHALCYHRKIHGTPMSITHVLLIPDHESPWTDCHQQSTFGI